MKVFFDSSALVKRYVEETGSNEVVELCAGADEIGVSVICYPEIISAVCRLKRDGHLTQAGVSQTRRELSDDLAEATVLAVNENVVEHSISLLEGNALKAMDALHVASALVWDADLFVSGDDQQLKAAKKTGLKIQRVG